MALRLFPKKIAVLSISLRHKNAKVMNNFSDRVTPLIKLKSEIISLWPTIAAETAVAPEKKK